jgi:hypothetical protein
MPTTFGVLTLVATACCVAALLRAHLLPTGYRPITNAVSDFGVGLAKRWYQAQASALGLAAAFAAAGLAALPGPPPTTVIVLLLVFAAARFAITRFPTDVDRSQLTPTGRVHILLAAAAFASIAVAAAKVPDATRDHPGWSSWHGVLAGLGWAVVATSIATGLGVTRLLGPTLLPVFGLIERLFYAAMLVWFVAVSIRLIES